MDYAIVLGPAEIIERLNRQIKAGLEDPVMKARFAGSARRRKLSLSG